MDLSELVASHTLSLIAMMPPVVEDEAGLILPPPPPPPPPPLRQAVLPPGPGIVCQLGSACPGVSCLYWLHAQPKATLPPVRIVFPPLAPAGQVPIPRCVTVWREFGPDHTVP